MNVLGISAFYHDASAALVRDGGIVAAAQEERFTRRKNDPEFPVNAIRYCLAEGGVGPGGLDAVVFYDKPIAKFARILETHFAVAPRGFRPYLMAIPVWIRQKLWTPLMVERALDACGVGMPARMYFTEHHEAHAASAFYPSPFERAAILTIDGVGEWACTSIGRGVGNEIQLCEEQRFPHSLGLLYSAFTYFTGFTVNSGEYKLMGLAPYGEPTYEKAIRDHLVDIGDDGSVRLNLAYFGYLDGLRMTNRRFADLFGGPARVPESAITRREADLAASIQAVTEDAVFKMARHAKERTGEENLCLAGGVALNGVANGRLLREGPFRRIWIQPAAGDAGGALGAALFVWHRLLGNGRDADGVHDRMRGAYLGPEFEPEEISAFLGARGFPFERLRPEAWADTIAGLLRDGKVVGLFQGRMEYGPRALGNRSILGDARSPRMQSIMNLKIKHRESFRPFAPSCLLERAADFFELDRASPYMQIVVPVRRERRVRPEAGREAPWVDRINQVRSDIPAVTHVDYSARVQTVDRETNPAYHELIEAFERLTGFGVVINTSFNVRGEPIVCTPEDAYRCFMRTEMDHLVLGPFLLDKTCQPAWNEAVGTRR
jgi:carbamoyltransferase